MWSNLLYWSCCQRVTSVTAKANTANINPLLGGTEDRQTKQWGYADDTETLKWCTFWKTICFHTITLPSCCVNLGRFCSVLLPVRGGVCCGDHLLTLASTVLEIRGWIPRGCWCRLGLWFEDLYYVAPSSPSSIKFRETEPVVAHKPMCHWIFIMYLIWGGEIPEMRQPPRPATQHPVIEALKCGCHFLPLGHG